MANIEPQLNRWVEGGVLDAEAVARIRAFEASNPAPGGRTRWWRSQPQAIVVGVSWQSVVPLILGAILLACGVALFVSAHWDQLSPGARLTLVFLMVAVFHLAAGPAKESYPRTSTTLHALGTLAMGPAIALVGQIFHLSSHWPSAVLLWAVGALAGWLLLGAEAQQTLALLLVPAWITCELAEAGGDHIGTEIYVGRLLVVWAILYLTFFDGSRRRFVHGVLTAAAILTAVAGTALLLTGWESYTWSQTFLPFGTRFWAWAALAALPLIVALFHGHKALVPVAAAIVYALVLPWCYRTWDDNWSYQGRNYHHIYTGPNLVAYLVVAVFAVFLCGWGVRLGSKLLVNFGVVGFAATVVWFYSSSIMTAINRSVALIGLGVLFLAGGWALEKLRRRMIALASNRREAEVAQ